MQMPDIVMMPATAIKRDGRVVEFDQERIEKAIAKCLASLGRDATSSFGLAQQVINVVSVKYKQPTVEQIQDEVERILQANGEYEAAKHYILYREAHAKQRQEKPIPEEIRKAFADADQYFPTQLQKFQFYDKYSRYDYEKGRRETWIETVDRAVSYLKELSKDKLPVETYERIRKAILEMRAMPSMRLLAMAGTAARRNGISIYNCAFAPVDSIDSMVEALIVSMSGCGFGFSVESKYVENFPRIKRQKKALPTKYVIDDSSEGWANALRFGLESWFGGKDVVFDYSQIRPAGAPLKIKGGRASGSTPLRYMLDFIRSRILARQGSFLRTLDAHDIMCAIGQGVVSGGHRRTAMLSLFDWNDYEMRNCKNGDFERDNNQRWNANNSAVWPEHGLTQTEIIEQMLDMVKGGRGEPGIFNRQAAINMRPERRKAADFGTNPCGEILLSPMQFCNLSIAVARKDDTYESLKEKVEIATIIGTIQSMETNFPGLRKEWKINAETERLLGVDITGQLDCQAIQSPSIMESLKKHAVAVNKQYAAILGINQSASVTTVKPSGNSSVLLDSASGIHARHSEYYIRNAQISAHSPVYKVMRDAGVPLEVKVGQTVENATTFVASFPVKSPDGAITKNDRSAIQQCEYWLQNKLHWTEHNPSVTISYKPDEVLDVIKWVYDHKDVIGGMSFLPSFDAKYDQMPYVEISKEEYEKLNGEFPEIDFAKLYRYEDEDLTTASMELACSSGICEVP